MKENQPWLFELPPSTPIVRQITSPISEEDCRQLGHIFAELLVNFLVNKQETRHDKPIL